ncbi:uncharacterized protein YrzB (UPF0473 family) [Paenibacillus castaneae]|uniref:DUF1292 domain-containing protein n=1 Tax=Paenibacillus castaneae TaxID=474957 RepID=UPI001FB86947|nr:DUF1292 domain-containing protein [Paenibacillus castaneae]NIK74917.1 uncharacterized protein YrzB (UPF0473 family) [Paenibacillus castaneae]
MSGNEQQSPKMLNSLKTAFGNEVELEADDGSVEVYDIKAEFQLGDRIYAALQSDSMRSEDEVELFRVTETNGEPQLETIEDDEEWEAASEAYDDLLFANTEQP